jgi:hypothetical protein
MLAGQGGVDVLIVAPHNGVAAAAIVQMAKHPQLRR